MTAENTPVRSRSTTLPPIPTDYSRLEDLYEIQFVLAQATSLEEACTTSLPILTRALPIRTVVVLDKAQELDRAFTWAAAGIGPAELDAAHARARKRLEYFAPVNCRSARVVTSDVLPGGVTDQRGGERAYVALPLSVARGPVFGVFQLETAAAFDESDIVFANALATQFAIMLDRHHARQVLETARLDVDRANRRFRDLQTISNAALEGATLDESLSAVLRAMCAMFSTEVAAVLLASDDGKTLRPRASTGLEDPSEDVISFGSGAAGRIAATGAAMFFDDLDELEGVGKTLRANRIRSLIGAPMRARGHLTGVVYVASRGDRVFTADELQLIELVADQISTIVDNAMLYERALTAIRSRDVVMGIVAHDLRNPLSAIQMSTELLPTDDPQLAKPVTIIKRSVDVMIRLITDLRDVGSIETGQLSIRPRPEDACALARDAMQGVRDAASTKPVRLEAQLPAREIVLSCDRIRVLQVLTNLLSNAIKFTPPGGVITISVAEGEQGYVRFSVEDTGCGIPEVELHRVFDRYWQAKQTAHLGTGLGLAIAKGIVESHGGTMSLESRVGHGTTFSFTLPLALDAVKPVHRTSAKAGARVLVVDDESNALSALAELLVDEGFVVDTAIDGSQALAKVRERAPDILVVDVELPGLKGPDLARKVREAFGEIPVILMTGHGDQVVATAQMELRASYVAKPLEIDELVSTIYRELEKLR